MRVLALFSGGKDSTLAAHAAMQAGWDVACLVSLQVEGPDSWMFHKPNVHLTPLQARAMGLPHLLAATRGEKETELEDLEAALRSAAEAHGPVEGVVSGALASEYQRTRIERVAHGLGLKTFAPLWHKDPEALLRGALAAGYDIRMSQCAAEGLGRAWLGRRLDGAAVDELVRLRAAKGLHVGGEGGEYESLVLDGPFFRQRLVVEEASSDWRRDSGAWLVRRARLEPKRNPANR